MSDQVEGTCVQVGRRWAEEIGILVEQGILLAVVEVAGILVERDILVEAVAEQGILVERDIQVGAVVERGILLVEQNILVERDILVGQEIQDLAIEKERMQRSQEQFRRIVQLASHLGRRKHRKERHVRLGCKCRQP